MGRSKNLLDKAEAEALAAQLNKEHPEFEHVAIHKDTQNMVGLFSRKVEDERILETSLIGTGPAAPAEPEKPFSFPEEEGIWGEENEKPGGDEHPDIPEAEVA